MLRESRTTAHDRRIWAQPRPGNRTWPTAVTSPRGIGPVTVGRQGCNTMRGVEFVCCVILLLGGEWVNAQEATTEEAQVDTRTAALTPPEAFAASCGRCHFCDRPTPQNPCLLPCMRLRTPRGDAHLLEQQAPDVVILDELEDVYLPVPFDHAGHARMTEMAQGCTTCHHYTPEGRQYPACKACHGISDSEADINKPALRGAYHQQCLNCHREWINERNCDTCHREKAGAASADSAAPLPTKNDMLGLMHPPIPEPDTDIYGSRSPQTTETQVIFRHREHVHRFGLRCVECHHERSCARCHARDREQERPRTLAEHHRQCIRCHKGDMDLAGRTAGRCARCHWREDRPKPEPFDHASTGWPLSRYHDDKSCRSCHAQVPFAKPDSNCNACHGAWSPSTFNHRVTGQVLDKNHAEHDCDVCHVERRFDRPPTCDECHEEDEGITFPAKRPGPPVGGVMGEPDQ